MVEKVTNRCFNCDKKSVCKYTANMKEITDKVNCQLAYFNKDLPFSIARIDCDYFSAEKTYN
jgi:hypothetical protein|nr:MAG TPA: hypothetical protein [Caudoviricetes sp.]